MARISLVQAINLNLVNFVSDKPVYSTLALARGVNEVDPSILTHPYIQAHMKAGSASIVPDPMDPEDIAAAAEQIAREARNRAEAFKTLKAAEQKKLDDALAGKPPADDPVVATKDDGPTVAAWVAAGYKASAYPPSGYASKSTPEEIAAAVAAEIAASAPKASPEPAAPAAAPSAAPSASEPAPAVSGQAAPVAPADAAPAAV